MSIKRIISPFCLTKIQKKKKELMYNICLLDFYFSLFLMIGKKKKEPAGTYHEQYRKYREKKSIQLILFFLLTLSYCYYQKEKKKRKRKVNCFTHSHYPCLVEMIMIVVFIIE